jgi:hypothetical protein
MKKIIWTDSAKNEGVLLRLNEERNVLHKIKRRKANWIGHISGRNCLLNMLLKEKNKERENEVEEVSSYRMTLRKKNTVKFERGSTLWRTLFGRCFGLVPRQTKQWKKFICELS